MKPENQRDDVVPQKTTSQSDCGLAQTSEPSVEDKSKSRYPFLDDYEGYFAR